MTLSGPDVALGIVKSWSIFAALSVSDLRLWGIGVLTMAQHHKCINYPQNNQTLQA